MKRILGLDLGTTSIGWAVINVDDNLKPVSIESMGSRIVPLSSDDTNEFTKGNAISKNQSRTERRTSRKRYDRYQLRRKYLTAELRKLKMLPDERLIKLPTLELWELRANAASKGHQLTLPELGRVLYHINQKRGYKHAKSDDSSDTKQKAYVAEVNARYSMIKEKNQTIGQYFAEKLKESEVVTPKGKFYTYRTKEQVFPRKAYEAEFDQIMECQKVFYPNLLTEKEISKLRNEIIFYQRNLKSCKHLVSVCDFEKKEYKNKEGKIVFGGPKVAPKSSPLFQICKIWEEVNNLTLKNRKNEELYISLEQRQAMVDFLDTHEKMTLNDMYTILGISKKDGWWGGKAIGRGLQGNTTKIALMNALGNSENVKSLFQFNLHKIDSQLVDEVTGEIIQIIDPKLEKEPLYDLWHTIYSISDKEEFAKALKKKYNITDETIINGLYSIDFVKPGFGNKSAKSIRRILPYLQEGLKYSDACEYAGFRHSESLSKAENETRTLLDELPHINKNELRQPIVEKILNQMINVVNALMNEYGKFDSIRVELARELKQSKDERNTTFLQNEAMQRLNESIAKRLVSENINPTKRIIDKYKFIFPTKGCFDKRTGKFITKNFESLSTVNRCIYCGQSFSLSEALNGDGYEIEHILPRDLICDNSQNNKVLSCRKCNSIKSNKTAFDYMRTQDKNAFEAYLERVESWYKDGIISPAKRERLLLSHEDYLERKRIGKETDEDKKYWEEFVSRQAGETQYISRESIRILKQCCRNVNATSGSITATLRHLWGYDEVLHQLNFERFKNAGLTETVTWESNHGKNKHSKEQIIDWSKRVDHRHHAIDALVVACTQQGFIQRINTLNADETKDLMKRQIETVGVKYDEKKILLDKYLTSLAPFKTQTVANAASNILVSFKPGKKTATTGKRIEYRNGKKHVVQKGIIIPRGALHEEGVYGEIEINGKKHIVKKYKLGKGAQGFVFTGKETYTEKINKKTGEIQIEDKIKNVLDSIVDGSIRAKVLQRLNQGFEEGKDYRNDVKKALENLNDLDKNPIYADDNNTIPIRTVRCITGLSAIVPIKYNDQGKSIGFVKPGNNHHIAIYQDNEGNLREHSVTFWHAVERKKYGVPVIIDNPIQVWDSIKDRQLPESFLEKLPEVNWTYKISLQQNEMFILGMEDDAYDYAIRNQDYSTLGQYLYKVQNVSEKQYRFSLHNMTKFDIKRMNKADKCFYNIQSIDALFRLHPHKVHISLIGKIKEIQE
jgi:CRISPR-associated endonuclease Csn1